MSPEQRKTSAADGHHTVDVLIPTYLRPSALAITLTSLFGQTYRDFRVIISDQSPEPKIGSDSMMREVIWGLEKHGNPVQLHHHLPRRGMAEQRQFLLDQATADYVLFLDDDLLLEPYVIGQLLSAIQEESCGFVGSAPWGLSYVEDVRPDEQAIEFWDGPVVPEIVRPDTPQWERYRLHNAANIYHAQQRLGITLETTQKYRVAWVGACVLYDRAKLCAAGGYSFWPRLPTEHAGEDVLAQLRVMARYGGCGVIPSGVYHQELATTVADRRADAPRYLPDLLPG